MWKSGKKIRALSDKKNKYSNSRVVRKKNSERSKKPYPPPPPPHPPPPLQVKWTVPNYRPISLLSCISKVLAKIIFKHVFNQLLENKLLYEFQSGFIPGHFTSHQLIELYHRILLALEAKQVTALHSQALVSFKKYMPPPPSSLLQGKHLPFTPSPLRLNIFRLFVILSLTQLYRYTPEIFLFSTAIIEYKYRAPLRRIGQEYSVKVSFSIFQSMK